MDYKEANKILHEFFDEYKEFRIGRGCGVGTDCLWVKVPTTFDEPYPEYFKGLRVKVVREDEDGWLASI